MTRPEWVEAGARALESTDFDYYPCDHGAYMQTCTKCLAAAVIAAVEPLIRADERGKARVHATGTSTGDGPCCECCYDVLLDGTDIHAWAKLAREANAAACKAMAERDSLRAQIAADLTANCKSRHGGNPLCAYCRQAVAVAEGE